MKNSVLIFYTETAEETEIFRMPGNEELGVHQCYAHSVLLSLGAFLTYQFTHLYLPENEELFEQQYKQDSFPDKFIETNPMFTKWVDYLVEQVIQGNALRMKDTLYFKIKVSEEYARILEQNNFIKEKIPQKMTWQCICPELNQEELRQQRKNVHYLMIVCSKLNPLVHSYHAPALFIGLYYNNENWKVFRTLKNEFPSQEDFKQATQIIVPGSPLCLSITIEPQVQRLINTLRKVFKQNNKIKYLGVCYGHQVLSQTFTPGSVRRAKTGVHQNTALNFIETQLCQKYDFLQGLSQVNVFQTHKDQVYRIPQNFTLLARSQSCANQVMISNDGRILTFQGHPEYTSLRYRCLIAAQKLREQNISKQQMLQIMNPKIDELPDQSPILQRAIQKFLLSQ